MYSSVFMLLTELSVWTYFDKITNIEEVQRLRCALPSVISVSPSSGANVSSEHKI